MHVNNVLPWYYFSVGELNKTSETLIGILKSTLEHFSFMRFSLSRPGTLPGSPLFPSQVWDLCGEVAHHMHSHHTRLLSSWDVQKFVDGADKRRSQHRSTLWQSRGGPLRLHSSQCNHKAAWWTKRNSLTNMHPQHELNEPTTSSWQPLALLIAQKSNITAKFTCLLYYVLSQSHCLIYSYS